MSNITLTPGQLARREHLITLRDKLANQKHTSPVGDLSPANATELSLLNQIYDAMQSRIRENEQYDSLMKTGKCAADALRDMVAALECDYDRLEELHELRDDFVNDHPDYTGKNTNKIRIIWGLVYPDSAKELSELETAAGECGDLESAQLRIHEDALEVTVRGDWHEPGNQRGEQYDNDNTEFCILLSTGGPATRIIGTLNQGAPDSARLEVQDWFQPWTEYRDEGLSDVLLAYAGCFYFGEG